MVCLVQTYTIILLVSANTANALKTTEQQSTRKKLLDSVFEGIDHGLVQGKGKPLSDIRDRCNSLLSTDKFGKRQLKVLLTAKYGNQIRFLRSGSIKKFAMIYLDCVLLEQKA